MATLSEALSITFDHYQAGRLNEAAELCRRILKQAPAESGARHLLAVILAQTGRIVDAVAMFRSVVALDPGGAEAYRNFAGLAEATQGAAGALPLRRALTRLNPADAAAARVLVRALAGLADAALDCGDPATALLFYREASGLQPDSLELRFNGAIAARDSGRLEAAAEGFAAASRLRPDFARARLEMGLALKRLGRWGEAARAINAALALDPADADALYGVAEMRELGGERGRLAFLRRTRRVRQDHGAAWTMAAIALQSVGRRNEAVDHYHIALALLPATPEALANLCVALTQRGDLDEAARVGDRAVRLTPDSAQALLALGAAFQAKHALTGAEALFRMALKRQPELAEAYVNLGVTLQASGRPAQAEPPLRRAIVLQPDRREQYANLGLVLTMTGRVEQGLAAYRRALDIDPAWAETHSDMIFAMDVLPEVTTADLQAARREFNQRHGVPRRRFRKPFANSRDPDRSLRIGYVTADFRKNSAAFAFEPIFREMDRQAYEIYCYSGVVIEDEMTARCRALATAWRKTVGVDEAAVADLIRADGVDILVDMSGHSSGNRLTVFARRPAPVQLSAWTHPHGVGLETMDYVFSDPVTIPASDRGLFMERIWDLPLVLPLCSPHEAPLVSPPPAARAGRTTFGCLNRLTKVTDPVIALWARLLRACPDADLLLKDRSLNDAAERRRMTESFARHGVSAERLRFMGASSRYDHLAAYGEVDIALDPFPLNGGVTTVEALWMGVPAVAMLGAASPSRASAAIMTCIGLSDWVAESPDDYVAVAAAKAADREGLAALRGGMRERFLKSPAGDIAFYTRAVERAYREMWRRWCRDGG